MSPAQQPNGFAAGLMAMNTFTLKDDAEAAVFEKRFTDHVAFMRAQEGFIAHQTTRSDQQPGIYVNAGWWRSPDDFGKVARSGEFQRHAEAFHQLVDVAVVPARTVASAEPAAPVGTDAPGFPFVVVTQFTVAGQAADFPSAYAAHLAAVPEGDAAWGVLGVTLSDPSQYTAVGRWRSADAWARAQENAAYQALTGTAEASHVSGGSIAASRSALGQGSRA